MAEVRLQNYSLFSNIPLLGANVITKNLNETMLSIPKIFHMFPFIFYINIYNKTCHQQKKLTEKKIKIQN